MKKNSNIEILFILPYFIFFIIFLLIPTVSGIFLSFTDYTGYSLKDIKFIGLENYLNLFNVNSIYFEDFWYSILRTSLFVLLSTPFLIGVPLIFAAMINTLPEKIRNVYRVIFYIPSLFSVSAIGLLGVWFFEQEYGLVNYFLDSFLSDKLPWVSEGSLGWIAILLLTVWWTIGGNLVIYLAGLKNISKELYEAAELDGANWFQQLLNITLPGLKNQIMFTSIMTVLASF
ncbi:MAG: carbohydrate ABC transporter permease, partial [Cetobacterium sp.]